MSRELRGALLYVALVFAAGFVLGPLREFVLAPRIGRLPAVLAELPLMLGWAWVAAGWVLRRLRVPPGAPRLRLGLAALALLLLLEFGAGAALRGWDARAWLADFLTPPGLAALGAYLVFALLPRLHRQP
ncbi:hypothetical protein ACI6QG_05640 [Roseococcus sp. DSY-14]|uniref:hypothetical protein n=1 Tax=Roseococcus sp. DSY-14 TaxID=3369650 RepID=UPI00387AEA3A